VLQHACRPPFCPLGHLDRAFAEPKLGGCHDNATTAGAHTQQQALRAAVSALQREQRASRGARRRTARRAQPRHALQRVIPEDQRGRTWCVATSKEGVSE